MIEYTTGDVDFDETIAKKWNEVRPKEEGFTGKYPLEEIRADLAEMARIENSPSYQKERTPVSILAEHAIIEGVNRGLLGEESTASITSRFDDVKKGTDMVVTMINPFDPEGADLIFGLDITVSGDDATLDKKLSSEFIRLGKKERTKLKYFKGLDAPINRYIIGMPPKQVKELSDILMERNNNQSEEDLIKKELAEELINQAHWQAAYLMDRYKFIDLYRAKNIDNFLAFFDDEENRQLMKAKMPPSLFDGLMVNRAVMEQMFRQMDNLEQKEKRDSAVSSNPSIVAGSPVDFLAHFRPDQLQGLQRAV